MMSYNSKKFGFSKSIFLVLVGFIWMESAASAAPLNVRVMRCRTVSLGCEESVVGHHECEETCYYTHYCANGPSFSFREVSAIYWCGGTIADISSDDHSNKETENPDSEFDGVESPD